MLAGITTAGWIAISVCIGICLGCLGTLTLQFCLARRRQQYAAAQHTGAGATLTGGKLRTPAAALPLAPAGIEYRPPPALAPLHTPSAVNFSPLSAKGPLPGSQGGALQMQQLTSSHVRISVDAGDILALQACDQGGGSGGGVLLQRDAWCAGLAQSHPCMASMTQPQGPSNGGPLSSQPPLCLSTSSLGRAPAAHGMQHHPQPQPHPHQLPMPAGCISSLAMQQQLRLSQALTGGAQQQHHGRASYAALPPAPGGMQGFAAHRVLGPVAGAVQTGQQQHHHINDNSLESRQPAPEASGYAAAGGIASRDSVSSFASSGGQPAQQAAAAAAGVARSPRSSASSPGPAASATRHGQALQAEHSTAASGPTAAGSPAAANTAAAAAGAAAAAAQFDLDDEYEVEDLDADWRQLLGDLDGRLAAAGAAPLTSHERAVAIKQLLQSTGTRGVDAAMSQALAEVLQFRSMHGRR